MCGRVGDADACRSGALHDFQEIECATDAADFAVVPGHSIFNHRYSPAGRRCVREFGYDLFAKQTNALKHPLMLGHTSIHNENDVVDVEGVLQALDFLADLVRSADDLHSAFEHLFDGFWYSSFLAFHP